VSVTEPKIKGVSVLARHFCSVKPQVVISSAEEDASVPEVLDFVKKNKNLR
jgi:hypothetical protein